MMGHKEKLRGGDEQDAFTGWRRFIRWKPGQLRKIKRGFWKRLRRKNRLEARHGLDRL